MDTAQNIPNSGAQHTPLHSFAMPVVIPDQVNPPLLNITFEVPESATAQNLPISGAQHTARQVPNISLVATVQFRPSLLNIRC